MDALLNDVGDGRRIRVEDLLEACGLDNYDENDDYPTTSKKYPRTPGLARTPARFRDDSEDEEDEPTTRRSRRKPTTAVKDRKLTEVQLPRIPEVCAGCRWAFRFAGAVGDASVS